MAETNDATRRKMEFQAEVQQLLDELPSDITDRLAEEVPITFEARPNAALVRSGLDEWDTLGLFTGVALPDSIQTKVFSRHRSSFHK